MTLNVEQEYREKVIRYRTGLLAYLTERKDFLPGSTGIPMLRELNGRLSREYKSFMELEYPKGFLAKLTGIRIKVGSMSQKNTNDSKTIAELERMVSDLS